MAERKPVVNNVCGATVQDVGNVQRVVHMAVVDKPRTFSKKLSSLEFSVIVGSRSAPYTDGNDLTKVLAGVMEASKDPKAVEKYGAAAMPEHVPPMSTPLHASHDHEASQLSACELKAPLQAAAGKKDGSIVVGSSMVPEHMAALLAGSGLNEFAVMSE